MWKKNHSPERCYFAANAANRPPLCNQRQNQVKQNDTRNSTNESVPTFELERPRFDSGAVVDRPETTETILSPSSSLWIHPRKRQSYFLRLLPGLMDLPRKIGCASHKES